MLLRPVPLPGLGPALVLRVGSDGGWKANVRAQAITRNCPSAKLGIYAELTRRLHLEMMGFGFACLFNPRFQSEDLLIQPGCLSRALAFKFCSLRPFGEIEELNFAPAV